jgi:cell division GTPase FtsZ
MPEGEDDRHQRYSDAQQRTCLTILSITDLLMVDGLICLDLVDVSSVMPDGERAVVGIGEAAARVEP